MKKFRTAFNLMVEKQFSDVTVDDDAMDVVQDLITTFDKHIVHQAMDIMEGKCKRLTSKIIIQAAETIVHSSIMPDMMTKILHTIEGTADEIEPITHNLASHAGKNIRDNRHTGVYISQYSHITLALMNQYILQYMLDHIQPFVLKKHLVSKASLQNLMNKNRVLQKTLSCCVLKF